MNGGLVFLIILILLLVFGFAGWTLYSRLQAKRLGLPPPSLNPFARSSSSSSSSAPNYPAPAPGGIKGFFQTQLRKFKNRNNRSAAGAYEEPSDGSGGGGGYAARGRGGNRLDPDEAWDSHVGNEAYYEEQELGLHAPQPSHGQTPYGAPSPGFAEPARGRSRNREYEEGGLHVDSSSARNPFGDDHAASLRGVSPRPLDYGQDTSYGGAKQYKPSDSVENSPTESRRSAFRENM